MYEHMKKCIYPYVNVFTYGDIYIYLRRDVFRFVNTGRRVLIYREMHLHM